MAREFSKYSFNYSSIFWFTLFTLTFLILGIINSSASTQVTLEWDSNSEPDLVSYKVFCREKCQNLNMLTG